MARLIARLPTSDGDRRPAESATARRRRPPRVALVRAHQLGLLGVVLHPGTCTSGTEADGLRLIADAVREAWRAQPRRSTMILFEHTAGQGRTLGHRFEQLATIQDYLDGSPHGWRLPRHLPPRRVRLRHRQRGWLRRHFRGVRAPRRTPAAARVSRQRFETAAWQPRDRHAHIGDGVLGLEPFRRLVQDPRFAGLPLLIETEKTPAACRPNVLIEDPLDARNLATLRALRTSRA